MYLHRGKGYRQGGNPHSYQSYIYEQFYDDGVYGFLYWLFMVFYIDCLWF